MKKILYFINEIKDIPNFLSSILAYDNKKYQIVLLIRDINSGNKRFITIKTILENVLRNIKVIKYDDKSLDVLLNLFEPNVAITHHKNSNNLKEFECFKLLNDAFNSPFVNSLACDFYMLSKGINTSCSFPNIYIDIGARLIDTYDALLGFLGLENEDKEMYLLNASLNGFKCLCKYADAFEIHNISYEEKEEDSFFEHSNNYYRVSCFNRETIENLKDFETFLMTNKRENRGEPIGNFYASFINKQTNSSNKRNIYVLFDSKNNIIGTRTIETAKGSMELKGFEERELNIFDIPFCPKEKIKITGDLVIDKDSRGKGLGKKFIEHTNQIAFKNNWVLYGSTCWDDTTNIYKSIGIEILNQLDKSIKYKWINKMSENE